jgi:hypothetical protein
MSVALKLYEQLTDAGEDKTRAKLIAEAFEAFEDHYPHLRDVATQSQVKETELRLIKEIEAIRRETESIRGTVKETEGRLKLEIEVVRGEIKETEGRLKLDLEAVRGDIRETEGRLKLELEGVRGDIRETEGRLKLELEGVRGEIKDTELKIQQTEIRLLGAIHRQTFWVIGSVGSIIGFIRLLDWLLASLPK